MHPGPIACGIKALEKVLFVGIRDAEQEVGQPVAAVRGAEVVCVNPPKSKNPRGAVT